MSEVIEPNHHGGGWFLPEVTGPYHHGGEGCVLEVVGSYHHGGGTQGVAGPSEVVPLDAVELPDVVTNSVVNPVQVGETASVKPPT